MSVFVKKTIVAIAVILVVGICIPGVMAYAAGINDVLAAKNTAEKVAVIQNNYQKIEDMTDSDKLNENAEKMDTYLASDALTARVPWYYMYGTWIYSGILQDPSGNPCVMWVCRENPDDTSSEIYAFATATYISNGSDGGYFTALKFRSTSQGIAKLPIPDDVDKTSNEKAVNDVINMVDELREGASDSEPIDKDGMAAAAEARNRYKIEHQEYPTNDSEVNDYDGE